MIIARANVDDSFFPVKDTKEGKYSFVKVVKGLSGVELLSLANICFDVQKQLTLVYAESDKYIASKHISESFSSKSWNFQVRTETVPSAGHWVSDDSYIMLSHSNRNIAHFTEVFNFVYHYLHNRAHYPPLTSIYFLQLRRDKIYPWILSYIDVASSLFPKNLRFRTVFLEDLLPLDPNGHICFRHAVASLLCCHSQIGVGRLMSYFYGGTFTSMSEADTLRSATYKYYGISLPKRSLGRAHVLVILREAIHGNLPGRAIENIDDVRSFFRQNNEQFDFLERKLELLKPSEQVSVMANTDIFIGALGSGFVNVMYMLPGSVAISFSPPNIGGLFFNTLSEFSRVHYIGVYNSSVPFPPECKNRVNANGESVIRSCVDRLHASDIFIDMRKLEVLMDAAMIHLKSQKYSMFF